jgi:hypothetical protein
MRCARYDRPTREGPDDRSPPLAPVVAELLKPVSSLRSTCVYSSFSSNFCDFSVVALTPPRHTQLDSLLESLRSLLVHHPLSFRPAIAKLGSLHSSHVPVLLHHHPSQIERIRIASQGLNPTSSCNNFRVRCRKPKTSTVPRTNNQTNTSTMSAQGYYNNGPAPQYPQQAYGPPQGQYYQQGPPQQMQYQQGPPMGYQQAPYQQGPRTLQFLNEL